MLYKTNLNKHKIKLRDKLYFSFSVPTPGFPHFYYMLGGKSGITFIPRSFRDGMQNLVYQSKTWLFSVKPSFSIVTLDFTLQNRVCIKCSSVAQLY